VGGFGERGVLYIGVSESLCGAGFAIELIGGRRNSVEQEELGSKITQGWLKNKGKERVRKNSLQKLFIKTIETAMLSKLECARRFALVSTPHQCSLRGLCQ
jgi:hypothetical protein